MSKLTKFFISIGVLAAVLFATIFGLSIFLSPDSLAICSDQPNPENHRCQTADVIVAISGGDTAARAEKAISLYHDGWAKNIIFAGAAADPESPSNAEQMRKIAVKSDVPVSAIIIERDSANTIENARNVAEIIDANGWRDVILVSENYHLRRAGSLFQAATDCDLDAAGARAAAGEEACAATIVRTTAALDDSWWWMTPRGWRLVAQEFGGIVRFWAGGGKI